MAKNYFKSYIWLLETLQSRGPLTLAQIKDLWMRSSINNDGKELATRTFANHIASIADIFGVDILCDRRNNTYYIDNSGDIGSNNIHDWMMEALSLNSLINESAGLRTRLIFESEPSSHCFLTEIIRAIRDGKMLEVNYLGFKMDAPRDFLLEPYCLKEYKRRWYLFACKHGEDRIPHSFALDRMNTVVVSEIPFVVPKSFDSQTFFGIRYGVLLYEGEKQDFIKVKVTVRQANYLRTLPLHSSQKEIEKTPDYSIFSYNLIPNWDFIHDILYFGDEVTVLEPENLRQTMKEIINKQYNNYGNNQ